MNNCVKRLVSFLLAFAIVAGVPVMASASSHAHVFSKKVAGDCVEATCGVDGKNVFQCEYEGCTATSEVTVPKTSKHKWNEGTVTLAATYTDKGKKTFKCEVCGETKEEEIPMLVSYKHGVTKSVVAIYDSSSGGSLKGYLPVGAKFELVEVGPDWVKGKDAADVEFYIQSKSAVTLSNDALSACAHTGCSTQTVKAATCTASAYTVEFCNECGQFKAVASTGAALGHDWGEYTPVPGNPAKVVASCKRSGCSEKDIQDTTATEKIVTVKAGRATVYKGSGVDKVIYGYVKQGGVALDLGYTTDDSMVCIDTTNNLWISKSEVTLSSRVPSTCTHPAMISEDFVQAMTCTTPRYVTSRCPEIGCNFIVVKAPEGTPDHSYGEWVTIKEATVNAEGKREHTCSVCNKKEEESIAKLDMVKKTGVMNKADLVAVYSDCSATKVLTGYLTNGCRFTAEKYSNDEKWVCFLQDGVEYWVESKYVTLYDEDDKATCSAHKYDDDLDYIQNATCEEKGFATKKCLYCGRFKLTATKALGHDIPKAKDDDYEKYLEIKVKPTEDKDGEAILHCRRDGCKHTVKVTLDRTGVKLDTGYISGGQIVKVYDGSGITKKFIGYATLGSKITVYKITNDKSMICIDKDGKKWIETKDATLNDATSNTPSIYAGATHVGTVNVGIALFVRSGASDQSTKLEILPAGTEVAVFKTVPGAGGEWAKISRTENKWVRFDYLKCEPVEVDTWMFDTTSGELILNPVEETPIATGTVTSTVNLNVRESASVYAKKLTDITGGTIVDIYEITTVKGVEWGRIKINSGTKDAWICLSYVSLEKKEVSAPPAADTNTDPGIVGTGIVTSAIGLNVRSDAYVSPTNLLGKLNNNTKVTILEKTSSNGSEWGRINQDGFSGWICLNYVTMDAGSGSGAAAENATVVNCSSGVNLRSGNKVTSALLGKIPVGSRVAITEVKDGWGYVNGRGWVYMEYISMDEITTPPAEDTNTESNNNQNQVTKYTNVSVTATLNGDTMLRETASNDSKQLMGLKADQKVTVIDRTIVNNGVWYKLNEGGKTGWVDGTKVGLEDVTGEITATEAKVYKTGSIDSEIVSVLGKGSKVKVVEQTTDGIYVWGKIADNCYIQMHNMSVDANLNDSFTPVYTIKTPIAGSVDVNKTALKTSPVGSTLAELTKDTKVSVEAWMYHEDTKTTWGKVTQGNYIGWINLAHIEQDPIVGYASAEVVNLYEKVNAKDLMLTIRSGDKVTVTERFLNGASVWGKMVAEDDGDRRVLYANMAGIRLEGEPEVTPDDSTNSGNSGSTGTTTTPSVPETSKGTAGVIANTENVNIRSAAGTRNALVTTLKRGTAVTVYETTTVDSALWGRIDQGWVAMQYVDTTNVSTGTTTGGTAGNVLMTTVPSGALAVGFTNVDSVNIRAGAGFGYAKTGTLNKNTNVVIYEQVLDGGTVWGRVDQGWICTSYVTLTAIGSTGKGDQGTIGRCFYTANIRSNPGTANALVGKVMVNSRVEVYETKTYSGEAWGRTSIGWIAMQYVVTGDAPLVP